METKGKTLLGMRFEVRCEEEHKLEEEVREVHSRQREHQRPCGGKGQEDTQAQPGCFLTYL